MAGDRCHVARSSTSPPLRNFAEGGFDNSVMMNPPCPTQPAPVDTIELLLREISARLRDQADRKGPPPART
jgi:hypothetical protein